MDRGVRQITKAKMLEYYEAGLLEDILVLPDMVVARKRGHFELETEALEVVWTPIA